jgi:hypothetical protein
MEIIREFLSVFESSFLVLDPEKPGLLLEPGSG